MKDFPQVILLKEAILWEGIQQEVFPKEVIPSMDAMPRHSIGDCFMRAGPVGCISTCAAGALAVSTAPVVHYLKDAVAAWRTT